MHTSQMWQLNTASECIDVAIVNYGMLVTSILCTAWLHCKQLHKPSGCMDALHGLFVYLTPLMRKCMGISRVCEVFAKWPVILEYPRVHAIIQGIPTHLCMHVLYRRVYKINKGDGKLHSRTYNYIGTVIVPANNPTYVLHCAIVRTHEYANHLIRTCDHVII